MASNPSVLNTHPFLHKYKARYIPTPGVWPLQRATIDDRGIDHVRTWLETKHRQNASKCEIGAIRLKWRHYVPDKCML